MQAVLADETADLLFLSGCADEQVQFYPQFDHVILLSAPASVLVDRLKSRTGNMYGKRPQELARVLGYIETIEPLLRERADLEVDTTAPVDAIVDTVIRFVSAPGLGRRRQT